MAADVPELEELRAVAVGGAVATSGAGAARGLDRPETPALLMPLEVGRAPRRPSRGDMASGDEAGEGPERDGEVWW